MAGERDRDTMLIRLPPDHMRRLNAAAEGRRMTRQSFVAECVMAEVSSFEENRRIRDLEAADGAVSAMSRRKQPQSAAAPQRLGLGITNMFKQRQDVRMPTTSTTVSPQESAPVVVNVGANVASQTNDVERLATFIANAEEFDRDMRRRTAIEILKATTPTPEEQNVVIARLDEFVAQKIKTAPPSDGVSRVARMAFDKITSFITGE